MGKFEDSFKRQVRRDTGKVCFQLNFWKQTTPRLYELEKAKLEKKRLEDEQDLEKQRLQDKLELEKKN